MTKITEMTDTRHKIFLRISNSSSKRILGKQNWKLVSKRQCQAAVRLLSRNKTIGD